LLLLLAAFVALFPACATAAQLPVLAWTERSDWINVKTDVTPAAVGDGIADDTAAIQAALNVPGSGITIYFPPGTYKVTGTLTLNGSTSRFGVSLIGHGRSTILSWHGATNADFFVINGNPFGRYVGLVLDGRGVAGNGFAHRNTVGWFETVIVYRHVGLYNFIGNAIWAVAGDAAAMAETSYENCIFDHCATGMRMGGFNDYDHYFIGCDFIACGYGIYCQNGSFSAWGCFFSGSSTADVYARPEHACSVRRCKSTGSRRFIDFDNSVSPCIVQDCYVTGWTSTGGAISQRSTPMLLFNSRFVNPPNSAAPVRVTGKAVLCNNAAPQSSALVSGASATYTVPAGVCAPRVGSPAGSNITTFVNSTAAVPPVVYDAKVNFGAVGNGIANDTAALQNTINAARAAGGGAIAYIPRGNYRITSTLFMTGSNYVVGGSGYWSRLVWGGSTGGTMMRVTDPDSIILQNLMVGHHDSGTMNNGIDIEQTSVSGGPSRMTYEGVCVYGKYQKQPERKGLFLNSLGSNCTVVLNLVEGNLRIANCASATIIAPLTYEGAITVDGTLSPRTGFLGFMARLSTGNPYGIYVRNNNHFVMSDWYTEQCDNGVFLSGTAGEPSGRITIQGVNCDFSGRTNAHLMTISNYQGQVFLSDQIYINPPVSIVQTGDRPLNIVLFSTFWYGTSFSFTGSTATLSVLGNQNSGSGTAPSESYTAQTLADLATAFDDLQRLGNLDLDLNFSFVFPPLAATLTNVTLNAGRIHFGWGSESGVNYQLESSSNLVHWQASGVPLRGTGSALQTNWPADEPRRFFRINATR
jgi:hypothetical protein